MEKFEDIFQHNQKSLKEVWDNSEHEIWNQHLASEKLSGNFYRL